MEAKIKNEILNEILAHADKIKIVWDFDEQQADPIHKNITTESIKSEITKLIQSREDDWIELNIINILVNHKNGLEVGWLAKKLMGVEIEDHNYSTTKLFFYMDKIFDLAKEGKLKRKDYEIDIAIVSLWEIPDEDNKEGEN